MGFLPTADSLWRKQSHPDLWLDLRVWGLCICSDAGTAQVTFWMSIPCTPPPSWVPGSSVAGVVFFLALRPLFLSIKSHFHIGLFLCPSTVWKLSHLEIGKARFNKYWPTLKQWILNYSCPLGLEVSCSGSLRSNKSSDAFLHIICELAPIFLEHLYL